jgi:hypothetical protein
LLSDPTWSKDGTGKPVREGLHYFEYGKDNYWTGDKMVEHTARVAVPIFKRAFPDCEALLAFDNASNHCAFAADALVASKMNILPGGKQPLLHDSTTTAACQGMIFDNDHRDYALRVKNKGIRQALSETPISKEFRGAEGSRLQEEACGGSWQCHLLSRELNFSERFWYASKHYAGENCEYSLNGLRRTLPAAFKSGSTASVAGLFLTKHATSHKYQKSD